MDDMEMTVKYAHNFSHEICGKMRAGSVHVRHAIVEVQCVNVVIGVLLCVLLVVVRVVPIFLVVIL